MQGQAGVEWLLFYSKNLGCSLKKIRFIKLERPTSLDPRMKWGQPNGRRAEGKRAVENRESVPAKNDYMLKPVTPAPAGRDLLP